MREDFPEELVIAKSGRRKPRQVRYIIRDFPEFWQKVLDNTDPQFEDRIRYDLFWFGNYSLNKCNYDKCDNYVMNPSNERYFCCRKCGHDSGLIQEKIANTCIEKYGSVSSLGSKEVRKKGIETCLERYGVENGGWSQQAQDKIANTCMEKYGSTSPAGAKEIRDKMNETTTEKYGGISPFSSKSVQEKSKNTIMERYGVDNVFKLEEFRNTEKMRASKSKGSSSDFIKQNWDNKIRNSSSKIEEEICSYIESFNLTLVRNNRHIIGPKELDIYIPEKNLAIEINGNYWHSSGDFKYDEKANSRHLHKTNLCDEIGINLFHLFEGEWIHKKENCKNIIKSMLGIHDHQIRYNEVELDDIDILAAEKYCNYVSIKHFVFNERDAKGLFYNNEMIGTILIKYNTIVDYQISPGYNIMDLYENLILSYDILLDRRMDFVNKKFLEKAEIISPNYYYTERDIIWSKHEIENKYGSDIEELYKLGFRRIWDSGSYHIKKFKE